MMQKSFIAAGVLSGALLFSTLAAAAPGVATGNVNMRSGPGTQFGVIATIPAGAPIEVFGCQSWCQVGYAGREGYVSGNYVSSGYAQPAPQVYYQPAPPPVIYGAAPLPRAYWNDRRWRDNDRRDRWDRDRRDRGGIYFEFGR